MRDDFEKWLRNIEKKAAGTIVAYINAIEHISQHYSGKTGKNIDLYRIDDLEFLQRLYAQYSTGGKYEDFGDQGHGTPKAAMSAYIRYVESEGLLSNGDMKYHEEKYELTPSGNNVEILIKKKPNQNINIRIIGE